MEGVGLLKQILNNKELSVGSRIWNLIQDTFLAGAVYKTTSYLFSLENITKFVNYCLHILGLSYNTITIFGKPRKKNPNSEIEKEVFSVKFKAVLHQVKQAGYSNAGVHQLVEGSDPDSETDSFIVAQTTTFTLAPSVYCTIMKEEPKEKSYSWDKEKPTNFRAEIFSRDKSVEELEVLISSWIKEYNQYVLRKGESMIELIGLKKRGYNESFDFSNKFLAVIHKMKNLNYQLPNIKVLTEIHLKEPKERYSRSEEEEETINAEALVPIVCQIEKDVLCKIEWKTDKAQFTEYSITIFSDVLNTQDLTNHLGNWEKEYNDHNQVGEGLKYFVFNPSKENENKGPTYTEFSFDSGMTFKNVFFPEKESLLEKIDFFQKNEEWYTERGIPYTLGLLLHGEPGCGKTSAIKAIANMTSRHIISVPLKNVKTTSELYSIFFGAKFNTRCFDMNKRLYVLEDIDCGGLKDIVKMRRNFDEMEEECNEDSDDETLMDFKKEITKLKERMSNREQKEQKLNNGEITLSDILEVFDGVMETKGRMMVITTNHLNKLDPALIRPGRVDTCLELRKSKPEAIMSIFNNFYGEENIPKDFDINQVPSETWTPAEIVQIFVNNSTQPSLGLQIICEKLEATIV